jgi:hypothetical protein
MSLLKTKPSYCPTAVATSRGWVNPATGEVLVAIGNLDKMLAAEAPVQVSAHVLNIPATPVEAPKTTSEPTLKEVHTPRLKRKQKLLGEVVEAPSDNLLAE